MAKPNSQQNVTQLLQDYRKGDQKALGQLLPVVYDELRKIARAYLKREHAADTLQPTALVHEAFCKLIDQKNVDWQNRSHFFGISAQLMRRILVDHARARMAEKRGGPDAVYVTLASGIAEGGSENADLMALDGALTRLAEISERQAKIVELRYFTGLSIEDTAIALDISPATVKRDWLVARAWLHREIQGSM